MLLFFLLFLLYSYIHTNNFIMTHIWLIWLGTMWENLVKNIISRDEPIVIWNRTYEKSLSLVKEIGDMVITFEKLEECISHIETPRNIFLLVPAGSATHDVATKLFSLLSPWDAIWDLWNAHWDTTILHQSESMKHGIHWIGCGISWWSEWARLGPSIMPGGDETSIRTMLPILEKIAAKDFYWNPCVTYVGKAAAGNFVKMVHNGIEYAIMQGIAEIYALLRESNTPQSEIKKIFQELNTGLLKSFLLDISVDILGAKDTDGWDLLSKISDIAWSKWTGGWTIEAALKLGVPVPSIAEALFSRWMSWRNHHFTIEKDANWHWYNETKNPVIHSLRSTLILIYLGSYLQGIDLLLAAEKEFQWWINMQEVLRIWQGGCIIRSKMLEILPKFLSENQVALEWRSIEELLLSMRHINDSDQPTPVIDATYNYLQTFFVEKLPTNLIQAMRDSFGSHGVKRVWSDISENFIWK